MSTRSMKYAPSPRQRLRENTPAFITSQKTSFQENVVLLKQNYDTAGFRIGCCYNTWSQSFLLSTYQSLRS